MNLDLSPDYFEHPKTLNLIAQIGPRAEVYPIRLWCWAMKFAKSGTIPGGEKMVALACKWTEKPEILVSALMSVPEGFRHGFLESGFKIHDWMEQTGGALKAYDKKKKRQRSRRLSEVFRNNSGTIPAPCPSLPGPSLPGQSMPTNGDDSHVPEDCGNVNDRSAELFGLHIWKPYPPKRKPEREREVCLAYFQQTMGGTEEEAKRVELWIRYDLLKSKDWKQGVIPNLNRYLRELPEGKPRGSTRQKPTDVRPPEHCRCDDCKGYGCPKCNKTGIDQSKFNKSKSIEDMTKKVSDKKKVNDAEYRF